jgi:hypothetical protein
MRKGLLALRVKEQVALEGWTITATTERTALVTLRAQLYHVFFEREAWTCSSRDVRGSPARLHSQTWILFHTSNSNAEPK